MYDPTHEYSRNILVTGATGMIGRAVCRELVVNGYRVHGLVRDDIARAKLEYAVIAVMGDIRRPELWENAIKKCDAVINLALPADFSSGKIERADAEKHAALMAETLERFGDICRRQKKKFIHTFGSPMYEPDANGWVRENSGLSSGRGYGVRHRVVYPVLQDLRKRGLKAMSVNPSFLYGLGGWFEDGVLRPLAEGRFRILGDGTQTMHYVASSDTAAAYRLALEHGLEGEDYLIADDKPSTIGECARLVAKELGVPAPASLPEEDAVAMLGGWAYEAYTYCPKVDSTKAREHLGWTPKYRTIQDGMPVLVREFKKMMARPPVDWAAEARERFYRTAPQ